MSIQIINKGGTIPELIGLSTDAKPTANMPAGSKFEEVDTGKKFMFYGTAWYPLIMQTSSLRDILAEQKTQANAVAGVLTFASNISVIEIYNTDATNVGVFTVNGLAINVPAGKSYMAAIGGTPSPTVTVTGATTYIVNRYV